MRQGLTGKKVKVGSHLDGPRANQCPACDRGQRDKCLRLKHCIAQKRSPNGTSKRQQGECCAPRVSFHVFANEHRARVFVLQTAKRLAKKRRR